MLTHYDVLQVARDASTEVIRAAYRSLSKAYHPDRRPGDAEAARIMTQINASYEVLSDFIARGRYDAWLERTESESSEEPETEPDAVDPPKRRAPTAAARLSVALSLLAVGIVWGLASDARTAPQPAPPPYVADLRPMPSPPQDLPVPDSVVRAALGTNHARRDSNLRAREPQLRFAHLATPQQAPSQRKPEPTQRKPEPSQRKPEPSQRAPEPSPPIVNRPVERRGRVLHKWSRPAVSPNGKPWPASAGYIAGVAMRNTDGLSTVTVDNSQSNADVHVKLFSLDAEAYAVREFFIPAGSHFTAKSVSAGRYEVRFRDLNSGKLSRSEEFLLKEVVRANGTQFTVHPLTLYKVVIGNMRTYSLAEGEF